MIQTACDAKFSENDLAVFTAGADMTVYTAFDTRVDPLPEWLSDWEKTELTLANDGDVTFAVYKKAVKSGDTVTLGKNGQSAYCVNYTVFAKEDVKAPEALRGDVNRDGDFNVADLVLLEKWLLDVPDTVLADWETADLDKNGLLETFDLVMLRKLFLEK